MDHHAAFLEAIIATPHDDTPRLIYADWLEENGEPERAEFIRVQIALTKAPDCPLCRNGLYFQPFGDHRPENCLCEGAVLRRRADELLDGHVWKWAGMLLEKRAFRRGFVESIVCTCADWLKYGPTIARSAPIREVRLSHREPLPMQDGRFAWWRALFGYEEMYVDSFYLPKVLSDLLSCGSGTHLNSPSRVYFSYHSIADAHAALSQACILWARSQFTTAHPSSPSPVSA